MLTQNDKLKKSAVFFSVLLSVILILVKLFAFMKTDSLAVFSSLIDSVTDMFASVLSFFAIYFSTKPASSNHRYGYGKTEALSALLQAIFVGFSGVFVIIDGFKRLFNPIDINNADVAIYVMLFSIFSTLILVLFQAYVAKKTNSLAIKADSAHYVVDFLTNSAVLLSLFLIYFFDFNYFDVISALFISIYLLYNAYVLAKESFEQITDKELSDDIKKEIENIVRQSKGIHGMHDFRSRDLGGIYFFEIHLELDGSISLALAHDLSTLVEKQILNKYPNSQILIHQDPYGLKESRLDHQIEQSCKID